MATATVPTEEKRQPWRFSVEDYQRMIEIGVLHKGTHVELIDGEVLAMASMNNPHAAAVTRLNEWFVRALADRANVRPQLAVVIPPRSQPGPDITLVRRRDDHYVRGHPRPTDVLLVVEVAESSLTFDVNVKLPLYASAGIPEAWVVDLTGNRVLVATGPTADGYAQLVEHRPGAHIAPAAFPDVTIDVAALLRR